MFQSFLYIFRYFQHFSMFFNGQFFFGPLSAGFHIFDTPWLCRIGIPLRFKKRCSIIGSVLVSLLVLSWWGQLQVSACCFGGICCMHRSALEYGFVDRWVTMWTCTCRHLLCEDGDMPGGEGVDALDAPECKANERGTAEAGASVVGDLKNFQPS